MSDILSVTTRGYTGHEHIDNMHIIHMNGRIYDPTLGRFLQADPFVQAPDNSQSYNRYTYVLNSPLSYTDPSGYIFDSIMKPIKGFIRSVARALGPTLSSIGSGFACLGNPVCIGYLQYNIARAHGSTSGSALKGAFTAAASAFAFQQIGGLDNISQTTRVLLHGTVGGISSVLQGGKFGHGFLSAGLTKAINVNEIFGSAPELAGVRIIAAAVIGGTISEISGGKFGNGAVTSAFGQMFNGENENKLKEIEKSIEHWSATVQKEIYEEAHKKMMEIDKLIMNEEWEAARKLYPSLSTEPDSGMSIALQMYRRGYQNHVVSRIAGTAFAHVETAVKFGNAVYETTKWDKLATARAWYEFFAPDPIPVKHEFYIEKHRIEIRFVKRK